MEEQSGKGNTQYLTATLEMQIVEGDIVEIDDIAFMQGVGQDTIDLLRQDGYRIENTERDPSKAVTRGAEEFIVLIMQEVANALTFLSQHQDVIEHTINDLGSLVTIFTGIVPAIRALVQANQKRQTQLLQLGTPINITIEIDNVAIPVDTSSITDQALLIKQLTQQFATTYPDTAVKVTLNSKVKVKGQVPRRSKRKRGRR